MLFSSLRSHTESEPRSEIPPRTRTNNVQIANRDMHPKLGEARILMKRRCRTGCGFGIADRTACAFCPPEAKLIRPP